MKWFKRRSSRAELAIGIAALSVRIAALKTEHSEVTRDLVDTIGEHMSARKALEADLGAARAEVTSLNQTLNVVNANTTMILDELYELVQGANATRGVGRYQHRVSVDAEAWWKIGLELSACLHLTSDPVPDLVVWHRGRGWEGHDLEDSCPCPQEECGLIASTTTTGDCPQHGFAAAKTLRQSHRADQCPGATP